MVSLTAANSIASTSPFSLLLRERTRGAHRAIEHALLPRLDRVDTDGYARLLAAFAGFIAPWEARMQAFALGGLPAAHAARLQADLDDLGSAPAPRCDDLPALPDRAAALGSAYVIEGSMLGGAVIARRIEAALGYTAERGCRYFAGGAAEVGRRWRVTRQALDGLERDVERSAATAAALATFRRLHAWLLSHGGLREPVG